MTHMMIHEMRPSQHQVLWYICGVVLLWLSAVVLWFLTAANLSGLGIFRYDVNNPNLEEDYFTVAHLLEPAPWVFQIVWALIYAYQVVFLCYMISVVIRKSRVTGEKLYQVTAFIPVLVLYLKVASNVLLTIWLFVADAGDQVGSLIIIVIDVLIMLGAYILTIYSIYHKYPKLNAAGFRKEDRLVVGIMLNSFGILLTWLIIAAHVNLTSVLKSVVLVDELIAPSITLTMLIIIYAIYNFFDLAFKEEYFRFLYGPHLPFVLGSIGIVARNYSSERALSVFQVGFMIVVVAVVPLKVCLDFYRERKRPRFGDERLEYEQISRPCATSVPTQPCQMAHCQTPHCQTPQCFVVA